MAPKIFFRTPLACTHCGTVNAAEDIDLGSWIGADPHWPSVEPGEAIDVGPDDLEGSLLLLHRPENARILMIEFFVCQSCRLYSPALIELRTRTPHVLQFIGATAIPALTREALDNAHFITTKIEEWTPQPGEDEQRITQLKNSAMSM
jgi:hypothetical protein